MQKLTRVPLMAILLLVVLRVAIGWQFLYEGQWKCTSQSSAKPWTSAGFLKNAEGPFRDHFREMVGDPDDLDWLNQEAVNARWSAWQERFIAHYGLNEGQQNSLDVLLNGKKSYESNPNPEKGEPVAELPPEVVKFFDELEGNTKKHWEKIFKFEPEKKRLVIDGVQHMTPKERAQLMALNNIDEVKPLDPKAPLFEKQTEKGPDGKPLKDKDGNYVYIGTDVELAFCIALDRVYKRQARLGFRERLSGTLNASPAIAGPDYKAYYYPDGPKGDKKVSDEHMKGSIEQYTNLLNRYEEMHADAELAYNWVHLDFEKSKLNEQKSQAVGPIKSLDKELRDKALKIVTLDQLSKGPVPAAPSPLAQKDKLVMTGLLVLGFCLISGLFTKISALLGAVMVFSFYLVMPPWPGVPPAPGPEHSFIVNKNLIEVFALLSIACFPTGRWFGIDAFLLSWRAKRKAKAALNS